MESKDLAVFLLASNIMHFVFCILVLAFIYAMISTRNRTVSRTALKKYIIMAIICLVADMLSYVFDMQDFFAARILNHISMFVAVFTTVLLGYWSNLLLDSLFSVPSVKGWKKAVYQLPLIVAAIVLVVNIFTGFVFEIGLDNIYRRGNFYFISAVLQYFYFALVIVRAAIGMQTSKTLKRHRLYVAMVLVGAFSLAFGAAQILAAGKIALHCFGITLGILTIFTSFLNDQITQDRLTGLNNRYALDNYMHIKMEEYHALESSEKKLYLIMMDMDGFKSVNDKYGHMAGDGALKQVALVLKKVAERHSESIFIARFGGDEFSVVCESWNEDAVIGLCREIQEGVAEQFVDDRSSLSISAGYAVFDKQSNDIDDWYAAADAALYKNKTEHKA